MAETIITLQILLLCLHQTVFCLVMGESKFQMPNRIKQVRVSVRNYAECIDHCTRAGKSCNSANYNKKGDCTLNDITLGPSLVGFWPLNSWHLTKDLSGNNNHALLQDAYLAAGPDGSHGGAVEMKGRNSSFVNISNNGALDVRYSMTLVMYVYLPSTAVSQAPLFEWYYPGSTDIYGVHFWHYPGPGDFFANYNRRGAQGPGPVTVEKLLKAGWNWIATSYNYHTGIMKVFGNGQILANKTIGRHELETRHKIRIGARDRVYPRYLTGRVSCVQLYDGELTPDEVFTIALKKCEFGDPRLKGFWPMGEKFTSSDVSGNENHFTMSNVGTSVGPTGESGSAYKLKGTSDSYIQIPNNGALDVRYSFTLALYVKVTTNSYGPLFEWSHDEWGAHIWVFNDFNFYQCLKKRGGGDSASNEAITFSNDWKFVATSYNYTSGMLRVYADGQEVGNKSLGSYELETARHVRIGARDRSYPRYLVADIACVQLYNTALTVEEIFIMAKAKCHPGGISKVPAGSCPAHGYLVTGPVESIPDRQLRLSSIRSCAKKASLARIDATNAGGFCGGFVAAVSDANQYLQFDLGLPRVVKQIVTRGRIDYDEWMTQYRIRHSLDGNQWVWIYSPNGAVKVFGGNADRGTKKTNTLSQPIYARYVRIRASAWHSHVSFRADLVGCYQNQEN